jgi:hypothetical protein
MASETITQVEVDATPQVHFIFWKHAFENAHAFAEATQDAQVIALEQMGSPEVKAKVEQRLNDIANGDILPEELFPEFNTDEALFNADPGTRNSVLCLQTLGFHIAGTEKDIELIDIDSSHKAYQEASDFDEHAIYTSILKGQPLGVLKGQLAELVASRAKFDNLREAHMITQLRKIIQRYGDKKIVVATGAAHTAMYHALAKTKEVGVTREFIGTQAPPYKFVAGPLYAAVREAQFSGNINPTLIDRTLFTMIVGTMGLMTPENADTVGYKPSKGELALALEQYEQAAAIECQPQAKKMMYGRYFAEIVAA